MKKIVNVKRYPIIIDTDTCDIKALTTQCRGIDEIYVIPEDSTIVWEDQFSNDNPTKIDVKKDDILITFYERRLGKVLSLYALMNGWECWIIIISAFRKKKKAMQQNAVKQMDVAVMHVHVVHVI